MRSLNRFVYVLVASAALVAPAVKASDPVTTTVAIRDFVFAPAVVKIKLGEAIVWVNSDEEPHTVVAKDKSFRSSTLDTSQKFVQTFSAAGEFEYFCSFHPHMTGRIVVE